jgi:hypothetical protein
MTAGPYFFAWCDEAARVDALGATLPMLVEHPPEYNQIHGCMHPGPDFSTTSVDEAVATIRAHFGSADADVFVIPTLNSGRSIRCTLRGFSDRSERSSGWGPLHLHPDPIEDFAPTARNLASGNDARDFEAEAVLLWALVLEDLVELLLRLCAPDESGRVLTGGCTSAWTWRAPVSMCATYHADVREIARDLALSWVSLHDGESVSRIAGLSMEALHGRVDAAPIEARVFPRDNSGRSIALSRETVLRALAMPGSALFEALVASANKLNNVWHAVEVRAVELGELTIELKKSGVEDATCNRDSSLRYVEMTGEHVYFMADHAPFHIESFPSGRVLLATHFYRTLWPLWADALCSLGLMS